MASAPACGDHDLKIHEFPGLMYLSAEKEYDFTQKPAKGFTKKFSRKPGSTALRGDKSRLSRRFGL
jgi:hypothetical protein